MAASHIFRTAVKNLQLQGGSKVSTKLIPHFSTFSTSAPAYVEGTSNTWSKLLLFVPGAISFGLGTWQIFRRQEKIELLQHRESRFSMEPLKGGEVSTLNSKLDALEFRRVKIKGTYDEENSVFIGPRSRSISGVTENGYYLITPLLPIAGDAQSAHSPILVNRGWVPRSWRDTATASFKSNELLPTRTSNQDVKKEVSPAASNVTEVIGVVRGSEKPSIFVPANDPNTYQWFYVDVLAIARDRGLTEETLYLEDTNEDATASKPYPIPKDMNTLIRSSVMPQDHLNYTMTWYTLSAAVTAMAIKRLKPTRRLRR